MNAPGKTLIKVSSIIIIVFSGFAYFASVIMFLIAALISSIPEIQSEISKSLEYYDFPFGIASFFSAFFVILGVICAGTATYQLIMGILGVKNAAKPEKSTPLIVLGLIVCALYGLPILFSIAFSFSSFNALTLIPNLTYSGGILAVYIIYVVGAFKNSNALKAYTLSESMSLSQATLPQVIQSSDAVSEVSTEDNKQE